MLIISVSVPAYAEVYNVKINTNSNTNECLPNCITPVLLTIKPGDSVTWTNMEHCVSDEERDLRDGAGNYVNQHLWVFCERNYALVSGNPLDGRTGAFDTGTIKPDQTSKSILFQSVGEYEYFDPSHKWIQGKIVVGSITVQNETPSTTNSTEAVPRSETVEGAPTFQQKPERPLVQDELLETLYPGQIENIRLIQNVGYDADTRYNVYYIFNKDITSSYVTIGENESSNRLSFNFAQPASGLLVLKLPTLLIGETLVVVDENNNILVHRYADHNDYSIVEIEMNGNRFITLTATYITPEYLGILAFAILVGTIVVISLVSNKRLIKI